MRLIDADWVIEHTKPYELSDEDWSVTGGTAIRLIRTAIDNAPTIDAVPIIRCKDCAYFHPYPFEPTYGSCKYHLGPDLQWEEKKETDYCSDVAELNDVG